MPRSLVLVSLSQSQSCKEKRIRRGEEKREREGQPDSTAEASSLLSFNCPENVSNKKLGFNLPTKYFRHLV